MVFIHYEHEPFRLTGRAVRTFAAILGFAVAGAPKVASTQALGFVSQWGSYGVAEGQFDTPIGIATDRTGNVYVTDYGNARVQVFSGDGAFLRQWTTLEHGYSTPTGVAVSSHGEVFVSEHTTNRIQVFSSDGTFLRRWGTPGREPGQLASPYGIALGPDDDVYIADRYNNRVQVFSPTGTFLRQWAVGTQPVAVATDPAGRVHVSTWSTVHVFTSDGVLLARFGMPEGCEARGIAVTADRILVGDVIRHRVVEFTSAGTYVRETGGYGSGPGQFYGPHSLCVGADGCILVTDTLNHRVQKLGDVVVPTRSLTWGRLKRLFR